MTVQTSLDEHATNFSLTGLRNQKEAIKNTSIGNITVKVELYEDFDHYWTIQDVDTVEELEQEIDDTYDAAADRLINNIIEQADDEEDVRNRSEQVKTREILPELTLEGESAEDDEGLQQFRSIKERKKVIDKSISALRSLYDRVGKNRRSAIGQKINKMADNVGEFTQALSKADETVDFEERVDLGESNNVFDTNRQATTGVNWYNKDGEERRMVLFSNSASLQTEDGREIRNFESKSEAKEYYLSNRLG